MPWNSSETQYVGTDMLREVIDTNWSVLLNSGVVLGHTGIEMGCVGMHSSGTGRH